MVVSMKEIFINNDNLKQEEIDEVVTRTKGLLINSKSEMLLGYSHNTYQFPGGHLEENETLNECLIREIKEETGIDVTDDEVKPFMLIKYYTKNYLDSKKNRCNKIYYFKVNTDKIINLNETNYTKDEKDGKYELRYIKLDKVKDELVKNSSAHPESKLVTIEMLEVLNEYFEKY